MFDASVHPALRDHLRSHGRAFPFRTSDRAQLSALLGHHGSLENSMSRPIPRARHATRHGG
jgi:hypothetical protein